MERLQSLGRTVFLLITGLLCTFSSSIPINFRHDLRTLEYDSVLPKRGSGGFSVLGMAAFGDFAVRPRLEIRELEKNHPDEWNVYLLGLWRLQHVEQDDKLSYFKISGRSLFG